MTRQMLMGAAMAAAVAGGASAGGAFTSYSFTGVTNNNAANTAAGEAQFELQVSQTGGNSALFTFYNFGPADSVMSELYWDDDAGVLQAMTDIFDTDPGVDYESLGSGVSPGNLPGGNTISFDADFATEPNNPQPHNGIGVGESLGVAFSLTASYQDVLDAIAAGELRIGVHAQSFANGGSESFVTGGDTTTGVPTPSAAALGLAMLVGASRRRRRA